MKRNPKPWLWRVTFLVLGHGKVFSAFNFLQSSGVVPTGSPSLILSKKFLQAVDPHSSKVFHSLANFDIAGLFLGSRVGSDEGITGATTINRAVLGVRRVSVFL